MKCLHKTKIRLYKRSNKWKSTPYYICEDCGSVIEIELSEIKIIKVKKNG